MFSAIMVTRFIVNTIYGGRAVKKLSIGPFIKAA
jgi:preprotein translocase subunit SecD